MITLKNIDVEINIYSSSKNYLESKLIFLANVCLKPEVTSTHLLLWYRYSTILDISATFPGENIYFVRHLTARFSGKKCISERKKANIQARTDA
jgi:hypothetical protein